MKPRIADLLRLMKGINLLFLAGLCLKTAVMLYSFVLSISFEPAAASTLYLNLNLSPIRRFSRLHYSAICILLIVIFALRALLLLQVKLVFFNKHRQYDAAHQLAPGIAMISLTGCVTGVLLWLADEYCGWFMNQSIAVSTLPLHTAGSSQWFFFAGILFIVSLVFRQQFSAPKKTH